MSDSYNHQSHTSRSKFSRRRFLKTTAKAGLVLAAPTIIPGSALGLNGSVPPSERIILGGIGIGPRGTYDLERLLESKDVQFVAICDVKKAKREAVKEKVDKHHGNSDCKMYIDMREYLAERTDIDAVLIATGDRWHAMASINAMRAGKDVYSEKPSAMTIAEGQAVVETARRFGRVYQTGTQRLSEANFVFADELVRLGRLGKVHTVRAHIAPWDSGIMNHEWLPEEPLPSPDEVNWDLWLGPCPWRPYNQKYVDGGWRGHHDFHTSCIGEWGAHTFASCQRAIGAVDTSPIKYHHANNSTGDTMETEFANGIKMVLHRDEDKKLWRGSCGVRYEGDEGWVAMADGYEKPDVSDPALLADFNKIVSEYIARTQHPMNHWRDFLRCVKSRRQTVANPEVMHRSMSTVHAANASVWLGRDMAYDPIKEEFVNDDEANRLRSRAQREPWTA